MITNLSNLGSDRRLVGASTIPQQVAKNFLLSNDVTFERKIKEAILAFRMDKALSKERILELYLNEIYLGSGSYGVAAAALNYFDKSLDELTLAEAATLAALPKAPNNYDPHPPAGGGQGAARLGDRPHAGGRPHHRRGGGRSARRAAGRPRRRQATEPVQRRLLRRGGAPRADPPLRRRGALQGRPRRAHHRRSATAGDGRRDAAARAGGLRPPARLARPDRPHRRRTDGRPARLPADWPARLAAMPPPAGLGDWRLAVLLQSGDGDGRIGFADGATGRIPRRADALAAPRNGPRPGDVTPSDDVIAVGGAWSAPSGAGRSRAGPEGARARWSPSIRTPAACWR